MTDPDPSGAAESASATDVDPAATTIVHLVRHGEVANPDKVLYGRIPGFHLSEDRQPPLHLVRHGEVATPDKVLYGRIPGFHLSEDGQLMAKAAADFMAGRDITVLRSSPLERAVQTAEPIAAQLGLTIEIDERLIEPWNHFEGLKVGVGDGSLRDPRHWIYLRNPFRPSWGEA